MKKELGAWLLFGAALLAGCSSDKPEAASQAPNEPTGNQAFTQSRQGTNQGTTNPEQGTAATEPTQEAEESPAWSSENKEVKLKPVKVTDTSYEGLTVEINGVKKEFDWSFPTLYEPQVFYADVTGDGKQEAVIIYSIGKGTGLSLDEIHVLDSGDFSEIKVPSYEETVANHIQTHITNHDDILDIKVNAMGKEHEFSYESPYPDLDQDELGFGGVVYYNVKNQRLTSTLGASIGVAVYVCDVHITYKFDPAKDEFVADQIEVEPFSNMK
ncbi:hypothetical protein ABEO75_12775 [Paenibacillus macerans]|uniref:hypothetical protein n=1 Tax=Paenibacillus macerans TaxID=44252 RepID=UPI002E24BD45|nr:hypothetical protein [Paenibacillus macerans]